MAKRYDVMVVEEKDGGKREGGKTFYAKIGSAWAHDDGKGFNVEIKPGLAAFGKIVIREPLEKDDRVPRSRGNDAGQGDDDVRF
jgi:hypothetical protein